LINRQQARIYLLSDVDAAELRETLLGDIPTRHHTTQARHVLDELLNVYRSSVKGLIVYDPDMLDSVNIATTLAGIRDAVVVSPRQAQQLQPHKLPVLADLRIYRWKNRLQAYRWATRNLLRETSPALIAGMRPTIPGSLRSYLVANRVFVYWLNPRFALPDPANGWTTERCLMKHILRSFVPGTPHLGWFIDEAHGVSLASRAALPVLPSDYFYNMEVWASGFMGEGRPGSPHPGSPSADFDPKIYVSFTMSDGDNLQFSQHRMYHLWQDPARGTVPLAWTISPALPEAAPALADYYMRTATPRDELIAGPSGAGYVLPSLWPDKQLPAYLHLTGTLMQRMRLTTVEVLDRPSTIAAIGMASVSISRQSWQAAYAKTLAPFGLRGILSGDARKQSDWNIIEGVPIIQNLGLTSSIQMALDLIKRNTPAQITRPHYLSLYMLAWNTTPSDVKTIARSLDSRYEVVTPGALLAMIARSSR
jgi:hypothetical protein